MSSTVPQEANSLKPSLFKVQEFEWKKRKNLELNRIETYFSRRPGSVYWMLYSFCGTTEGPRARTSPPEMHKELGVEHEQEGMVEVL